MRRVIRTGVIGAHPGLVEDRMYLAPQTIEFVSHGFPP